MRKEKTMFRTFKKEFHTVTYYSKADKKIYTCTRFSYDGLYNDTFDVVNNTILEDVIETNVNVKVEMTISDFVKYGKEIDPE